MNEWRIVMIIATKLNIVTGHCDGELQRFITSDTLKAEATVSLDFLGGFESVITVGGGEGAWNTTYQHGLKVQR